jgi:hypothetical protein
MNCTEVKPFARRWAERSRSSISGLVGLNLAYLEVRKWEEEGASGPEAVALSTSRLARTAQFQPAKPPLPSNCRLRP